MNETERDREREIGRERNERDRKRERGMDINSKIKRGKDLQELR